MSRPRRRRRSSVSALALIDQLLLRQIEVSIDGKPEKQTVIGAIVLQILRKAYTGNVRAWRVFLKYLQFASQNGAKALELTFLESAYTRAFASLGTDEEEDDDD